MIMRRERRTEDIMMFILVCLISGAHAHGFPWHQIDNYYFGDVFFCRLIRSESYYLL